MASADQQALLTRIREAVSREQQVRLVVLFGSHARGRARANSDVDLAVDAPGVDRFALAARLSERLGAEVDLVPLDQAPIPLLEALIDHGVVAYEAERGRAAAWRSRVLGQLETDRPWYRRMRDAWLEKVAREGIDHGR